MEIDLFDKWADNRICLTANGVVNAILSIPLAERKPYNCLEISGSTFRDIEKLKDGNGSRLVEYLWFGVWRYPVLFYCLIVENDDLPFGKGMLRTITTEEVFAGKGI